MTSLFTYTFHNFLFRQPAGCFFYFTEDFIPCEIKKRSVMDAQGLPQRSEGTPRLRKMVAGAAALRRKCALKLTLFVTRPIHALTVSSAPTKIEKEPNTERQ